ncbi:MAG TPA: bifunctional [glutamine synthetase] adenylyltransferase/[glutamine synthetase]-adenylyl-L-tyrosine phosphorylase [Corynebacterium kroppenstedtii]|nr:bifunctional [glutamine synthetase] adenylyltransferase/[glutamine synthetase]-adenylyl-L-tyrosine phosphorylase [Corynebacterium kroppenstedtii]
MTFFPAPHRPPEPRLRTARGTRSAVPSPSTLGLTSPHAASDLQKLGWDNQESTGLLYFLANVGDPELALNTLYRLNENLKPGSDEATAFLDAMRNNEVVRSRVLALVGGSAALGDHLVANPHLWTSFADPIPHREEMMAAMLSSVETEPAAKPEAEASEVSETSDAAEGKEERKKEGSLNSTSSSQSRGGSAREGSVREGSVDPRISQAGMYRAGITGTAAYTQLKMTYRTLLMRIAASDLASTIPSGAFHQSQSDGGGRQSSARSGSSAAHGGEDGSEGAASASPNEKRAMAHPMGFVEVSAALSDLADAALTAALAVAVATVYPDTTAVDARLAVIAMGKCGARELNYISDVDVIFVGETADAKTTRVASEFIKVGSRCFFEVDAALRPEGKSGALVRTLESHLSYYERWADTWEFQAQLKARPMTGAMDLGKSYVQAIQPRVWQASQRDSFVDDTQHMRRRVIDNIPKEQQERELKLGVGGLRDVEFAVQMLQMVHGRIDPDLRVRSTISALQALIRGGYVGREDGSQLIACYEFVRLLEHRLQLQRIKRTHMLPEPDDEDALRWLARSCGIGSTSSMTSIESLKKLIGRASRQIHSLHNKLFFRPLLNAVALIDDETARLSPDAARRQLAVLGYQFPDRAYEHLKALASGTTRKDRIQAMLLPTLMEWLGDTSDPDAGLLAYRKLSDVLYHDPWFLRMLRDEGIVGRRLMHILGTSPYATELILAAPNVVKLLGDGANGPKLTDVSASTVTRSLVTTASRHKDPDKAIAAARSLRRKELARIACADLLGMMSLADVCHSLSLVWDAVLEAALYAEIHGWTATHPDEPIPATMTVIGMGRLGGGELGYGSDADVLFVCEPAHDDVSEADAVKWAIGIGDAVRRRLAKPSQDPRLDVDLDLRPEGRNGPTVRTLNSYHAYYERWGETWEVQALLRATWIAGDEDLGRRFLHMIDKFRYPEGGVSDATVREVRRMKARVDEERLPRGANRNTHTKLGRGALTDIEWTVQLLTLQHAHEYPELHNTSTMATLRAIENVGLLEPEDCETLRTAWQTATKARNALVLVRGKRTDQLPEPGAALAHTAGAAGWEPEHYQEFLDNYLKVTRQARKVIDRVFWGEDEFMHR